MNQRVFGMEAQCVVCMVGNVFINVVQMNLEFRGISTQRSRLC